MELKTGSSRKVFLIGKYTIKIPNFYSHKTFLNGCRDNWSERNTYKYFKGVYASKSAHSSTGRDITELMVPSLFCSWFGLVQIQLRVEPLTRKLTVEEEEEFEGVCSDIQSSNFGMLNGEILCFDYAQ